MPTANFQTDVNLQSTLTMVAIHVKACVKKISHQELSSSDKWVHLHNRQYKTNKCNTFHIFVTNKQTMKKKHIKPFMGNLQILPITAINVDVSCQK